MQKVAQDRFAYYATTELGDMFLQAIKRGEKMKKTRGEFMMVWDDWEIKGVVAPSILQKLFNFWK